MKYIVIDERKDGTGDIFTEEFEILDEAIQSAKDQLAHMTDREKEQRRVYVLESVNPDEEAPDHLDGNPVWEHESMSEKKFWLDCDSNAGTQFALYEKTEDDETCILRFDFDDIDGLKELEEAGKIGEGYELIDKYIQKKLGFIPEYEVG